jgi:hypothetical protein
MDTGGGTTSFPQVLAGHAWRYRRVTFEELGFFSGGDTAVNETDPGTI